MSHVISLAFSNSYFGPSNSSLSWKIVFKWLNIVITVIIIVIHEPTLYVD